MKVRELGSIILFSLFVGALSMYVADRSEVGPHGELSPKKEKVTVVEKVVIQEKVIEKECPKAPVEYPKKGFFDFSW